MTSVGPSTDDVEFYRSRNMEPMVVIVPLDRAMLADPDTDLGPLIEAAQRAASEALAKCVRAYRKRATG